MGAAEVDPAPDGAGRAPPSHPGAPAIVDQPAGGVSVQSALSVRVRPVPRRGAAALAGRRVPRGRVPPLAGRPEADRSGRGAGADVSTTETISTPPPAKRTLEPLVRLEGVKKHFP